MLDSHARIASMAPGGASQSKERLRGRRPIDPRQRALSEQAAHGARGEHTKRRQGAAEQ